MTKQKRGLAELINVEWEEIDRLIKLIKGTNGRATKERYRYSMALAAHVHRLDKLFWKAGLGKIDEESLAKLLEKIPKRCRDVILKKVVSKRAKERPIQEA